MDNLKHKSTILFWKMYNLYNILVKSMSHQQSISCQKAFFGVNEGAKTTIYLFITSYSVLKDDIRLILDRVQKC